MVKKLKILRVPALTLAAVLIQSCESTPEYVITPDGKHGYKIDCGGKYSSWGECDAEAVKLCSKKGYEIVAKNEEQDGIFRNMVIQCKE